MMSQTPKILVPSRPSLASTTKPGARTSVTFQIDDTDEIAVEPRSKEPTRKNTSQSLVVHEIQSWSSFAGASTVEQVLADVGKSLSRPCSSKISRGERLKQGNSHEILLPNQERKNRCRSALIDRKRRHYHHHNELTLSSLFGTMPDINQIMKNKRFLRGYPWLQALLIFTDSCFRGVGQVMFANNPLSGFVSSVQNYFSNRFEYL
jgi:hypothetical protein